MITSIHNDKIKKVCGLQTKSKFRKKYNQFIVEGMKMIQEAPVNWIDEVYIVDTLYDQYATELQQICSKVEMVTMSVFKHISTSITPQGLLAVVNKPMYTLEDIKSSDKSLIVALENVQDPGNVGTIIRTSEAANVDYIALSKGSVDIYNPKVIRATMGSIFRLKIIENLDLNEYIKSIKEENIKVYAAHLKGAKHYYEADMTKGSCILIGNEGNGLTDSLSDLADENIIIPIIGKAESLNAALATGIIVYEAVRQRLQS